MHRCVVLSIWVPIVACSEYGLEDLADAPGPVDSGWADQPLDEAAPEASDTAWADPCSTFDAALDWSASDALWDQADPTDGAGLAFHDPHAQPGWESVALPHQDIPTGADRAYRTVFDLDGRPEAFLLDLQSDDGLTVWVNGVEVGQWGGGWQEEGCVNEHAECLQTIDVDPIDVATLLVEGDNALAARVSNPIANAWFEILVECPT